MGIRHLPGQIHAYLYGHYGWLGVAVAGVGVVLLVVSVMIWFDRRR